MKTVLTLLATTLLAACAAEGNPAPDQPPKFKTTLKRDTDSVEVLAAKGETVFVIRSSFGISQAIIQRAAEKWPDAVVLRLHLKGLESFRASNGNITLNASVSSQGDKARVWKDGQEDAPLDAKSPFWFGIRTVIGLSPVTDGCFEMTLPRAFFEGNPKAITVSWIDFYR